MTDFRVTPSHELTTDRPGSAELDGIDRKILAALREDRRMTLASLSDRVGLSKTPCQLRVKRLVEKAVILGFSALVDFSKLVMDQIALPR